MKFLDLFKKKASTKETLSADAMLQKAMQSPDYQSRLLSVAEQTLKLNEEELPCVKHLIEELQSCKGYWEYPVLMHNVVLLGRAKRDEMIPVLSVLLQSVKKDLYATKNKELIADYKYVTKTLKDVKENDTHPHVVYYDLSMFLTSFINYKVTLGQSMNQQQEKYLNILYKIMLSIMLRTETEKEKTIETCKAMVRDLTPKDELGQTK